MAGSYLWLVLYTNDPGQLECFGKGVGMSGDTRFSMECLRQFGLAGRGLRMSESGQQRVMLRSDYGRASGFRHGAMLCRQGTSSLLYFVYTLLIERIDDPVL